ncbi:MAG: hypothetical protein CMN30_28970 [Sandaracinus sp.]|nr:hypothetical protein [Sandaracinus sp.]|tara:strand:+ start:2564 stop:2842 length:279 start_codon:yes stop_codon:yes gene_type:complete
MALLKKGSKGEDVQKLQQQLEQLGYGVGVDGDFGALTHWGVTNLQAMFGYDVDGIVGPGTQKLIDAQVGYGWNAKGDSAHDAALRAQGLKKA